ncbi:MAG: ParA family protein [Candidatus Puniceispirillales bacterium]
MNSGFSGKGIFFGNIKGGVGKSTLCIYIFEMLRKLRPDLDMLMLDTDPQASSSMTLQQIVPKHMLRFMPMGDRYDGAITAMLDGVIKSHLVNDNTVALIDSAAGKIGNVWQVALLCNTIIVPTSLSFTDIRPTLDFIRELDGYKENYNTKTPHIIVVPNRASPNQKDYSALTDAAQNLNLVVAPPVSDYSVVRHSSHNFKGLADIEGTKFYDQIENLTHFIISHVLSGKLDEIFDA